MKPATRLRLRDLLLHPPALLGTLRQARALNHLILDNTPLSWDILAEVLLTSPDTRLRQQLWQRWQQEVQRGNREAVEGLCRALITYDAPALLRYVLKHGLRPQDELQRALFYFLTEQWEAYEGLDFDHRRLREAYLHAEAKIKQRTMELARRTGRIAWLTDTISERTPKAARRLTLREWKDVVGALAQAARWHELWRLAQNAPPRIGWQILRALPETWTPPHPDEVALWQELRALARAAEAPPILAPRRLTALGAIESELIAVSPDQPYIAWSASRVGDDLGLAHLPAWTPQNYRLFTYGGPRKAGMQTDALTMEMTCTLSQIIWLPQTWVWAVNLLGTSYLFHAAQPESTLRTETWHRGAPTAWARSADGRYAASATQTIILLDTASLRPTLLRGHYDTVTALTFTADAGWLISADRSGAVAVWDTASGERLAWANLHTGAVRALAVLDTNAPGRADALASAAEDGVLITSLPTLTSMQFYRSPLITDNKIPYAILALTGGPEGTFITGDTWGLVRAVKVESKKELWRIGHPSAVPTLQALPGGELMMSANVGEATSFKIWQSASGAVLLEQDAGPYVTQLQVGWHGRLWVGRAQNDTLALWDATLTVLPDLPLSESVPHDLEAVQAALTAATRPAERAWLSFIAALLRWRRRFEIELERAPERIQVGEFDIEVEG